MKIVIIQGDHYENSRKRLNVVKKEMKRRGWEIRNIKAKDKTSVAEQFSKRNLFKQDTLFIIDEPLKLASKDFEWISGNQKGISGNLIIYHQGYLSSKILKNLPKPEKVEDYKLPKTIWSLLDSIYPGNAKNAVRLLHQTVINEPKEFVFSLIVGRIKELYWLSIDEKALNYPSWRINKLKSQLKKFSDNNLSNLVKKLSEIDIKAKTSKTDIVDALDLLIISKLE